MRANTETWRVDPNALRGRIAVVAGATRGAGRGIATALGEAGEASDLGEPVLPVLPSVGDGIGGKSDRMIDMLLAKTRAGDRREWLMEKGNRAEVE